MNVRVPFIAESLLRRLALFLLSFTRVPEITAGNIAADCQWSTTTASRSKARNPGKSPARGTCGERPNRARSDGDSSADKADDEANDVNQRRNQRKTRDKVTASRYRKPDRVPLPAPLPFATDPKARGASSNHPSVRRSVQLGTFTTSRGFESGRDRSPDRLTFASHSRRIQQVKALLTSDRPGVLCATGSTPGPALAPPEPRAFWVRVLSSFPPFRSFFSLP